MKKIMFATALVAGLLGSASVFAVETAICTGASPGADGAIPPSGTAGTHFMQTGIKPKCSSNVMLKGTDGTAGAWYAVGSASKKGKQAFKAHTQGGSVSKNADCAIPGGCVDGEVTTALGVANAAAASS